MKRIFTCVVFFLACAGNIVGVASPASAAGLSCPEGVLCAWDGATGSTAPWIYRYSKYKPVGKCWNLGTRSLTNKNLIPGDRKWTVVRNNLGSDLQVGIWADLNCHSSCRRDSRVVANHTTMYLRIEYGCHGDVLNNRIRSFSLIDSRV